MKSVDYKMAADKIRMLPNVESVEVVLPPICTPDESICTDPIFNIRCYKKPFDKSLDDSTRSILKNYEIENINLVFIHNSLLDKDFEIWTIPYD